ncbi:MAG TPA: glutamate-5-semialdehyde dehydrogenase, partial [Planctomycetaceae bacterium]|nr:glutamate-5-semialdehyde dehydrogenase [Planctomycetaceae bacterium]
MATEQQTDLQQYCHDTAAKAKRAASELQLCSTESRNNWLRAAASALRDGNQVILQANTRDIEAAPQFNLTDAQIDRLRLNAERIEGIATALEEIADLPDPIGEVISSTVRPNGLDVKQVRVPLGVVFFIYESRPNVTADAAAICIKSGNAVILRGGKEAAHSSRAIVDLISGVAAENDIPTDAVQLVSTTDRDAVGHFLRLNDFIDVAIPRGGEGLIRRVADEATMPVIKHFEGNCHVYVDETADLNVAEKIVVNSKCQRMGVCNACESLLVHRSIADQAIPQITAALAEHEIEIRGDHVTCSLVETA